MRFAAVICLFVSVAGEACGGPQRAEIPIHQAVMSTGNARYSIPIAVGGTTVEAMLDTGSSGLYVLPGVLAPADAKLGDSSFRQSYNSGVELRGSNAKATLTIGGVAGSAEFGLIQSIDCTDKRPDCAASKAPLGDYRIGDTSKLGYEAIFGINFRHSDVDNPLVAIGVESWIVVLPKPGDTAPGTLILNPNAQDRAGYVLFHVDKQLGRLPGCLIKGDDKICGGIVLDSGAPGVGVVASDKPESFPWPDGAQVTLALKPDSGDAIGLEFNIHRAPGSPSALRGEPQPRVPQPFIRAGTLPYFAYCVFYDASTDTIGLKPR